MKPTEQQLKDPQWWDDNVSAGLDYCYTTDKDWEGDPACVNRYEFTDKNGFCGIDAEYKLVVRPKRWILHCKRPTSKPTETEHPEGATHKINGIFTKWVDANELQFLNNTWRKMATSWPIEKYTKGEGFKIVELPADPEAKFIPKVGEWCEILCDYVLCGNHPTKVLKGSHVEVKAIVDVGYGDVALIANKNISGTGTIIFSQLRPIKSERDVFIERAVKVTGSPDNWGMMFAQMYEAGFKAPETNDE